MSHQNHLHTLKRPAIERMLRIHQALKTNRFPNCSKLAKELEVSYKTISRDIDFMRDRMLLPIEYNAARHGFHYTSEVESMPTIAISEGELLALSIAQKSLHHYRGTPFEEPLRQALAKLSSSLPETITASLSELSDSISFRHGAAPNFDAETLQLMTAATLKRRSIEFDYRKSGATTAEKRILDPYHLTNYLGRWYVLGRDHQRRAIRTFLLSRASNARLLESRFAKPESFKADEYLWNSFGLWTPAGDLEVCIEFEPSIADYLSENTWHPTQRAERSAGGRLRLEFRLKSLGEVAQWILGWGTLAKALSPQELKNEVRHIALAVAERHR